ncbi:hypothetical protein [Streptomyces kronopolitis]|uniref:hypothetical protein n=1 Tax=Streptomyces kronopolitis TaxID=1612435 RepID=UPI0036CFB561
MTQRGEAARSLNGAAALVIVVLVVGLVVRRQLRTRPVRRTGALVTPVLLGVPGTVSLYAYLAIGPAAQNVLVRRRAVALEPGGATGRLSAGA